MARMTGQELRAQARLWFGDRTWQAPLAARLRVAPSTVWRWCQMDVVPGPVEAAVRAWQEHGVPPAPRADSRRRLPRL